MICALIYDAKTIGLIVFLVISTLFWIYVANRWWNYGMGKYDEEDKDLPDEVTIEIVHEKTEKPQDVQSEHSSKPSAEKTSFYSHSHLIGKGNYIPE
ncbi:MAG: hypothetical protein J1F12_06400 [Muribaculaceae bacterium]|nr:hypothetical protein [Muribaculaceae bacterium]